MSPASLLGLLALAAAAGGSGGKISPAAVPALTAETKALPPGPSSLPAIHVGDISQPFNPVWARLDLHAQGLEREASGLGGSLPDTRAAEYLNTAASGHPTDVLAARAIALIASDRGGRLSQRFPALADSAAARLGDRILPGNGYRGTLQDQRSPLAGLIREAANDPAVQALFDGGARWEWRGHLSLDDRGLRYEAANLSGREDGDGVSFASPGLPGARLWLGGMGRRMDNMQRLAEAGAGPRLLGIEKLTSVGKKTAGQDRAVLIEESVNGPSMFELVHDARFGPVEGDLVLELFDRLADAGLDPAVLEKSNIVIGTTLADPRRRAYLVDPGLFRDGERSREDLRASFEERNAFDQMEVIHGGDSALAEARYKPLGEIMRVGIYWATRDPFWRSWGRSLAGAWRRLTRR